MLALGSITGTVFDDLDGDGTLDAGETGTGGRVVYLDQNQNGAWDAEEVAVTTSADGTFQFDGLDPGEYRVAQMLSDDQLQITPGPAAGPALLGDVLGEIPLSFDPMGFTFHSGHIYGYARMENLVYQVDPDSGAVSPQFATPEGSSIWGLTSDGNYLWATDTANDMLLQLDMTGQVVHSLAAPGTDPTGITWDGSTLWVLDFDSQTIDQVDPATGQVVSSLEVPVAEGSLSGLAHDGQYLWMNRWLDPWATSPAVRDVNRTYAIKPGSGEVVREFVTPYARDHQSLGLAYDGEGLWVSQSLDQLLLRVDTNAPAIHQVTCDGTQVSGVDFGYFQLGSVSGTVYNDYNKDGVPDPGEPGLEGWRVFTDENDNGLFDFWESAALTDVAGDYVISGLRPGDYTVTVQLPELGWFATGPHDGMTSVTTTTSGQVETPVDFGSTLVSLGALGPAVRVNSTTAGSQQPVTPGRAQTQAVAMDAQGNYVVVWHGNGPGDDQGVFLQRYAANGAPLGPEIRVNTTTSGTQQDPMAAMAADTGQFAVAWRSDGAIMGQLFSADGVPINGEFVVEEATTSQSSTGFSIAMDADGDFAILYCLYKEKQSSIRPNFMVTRYNSAGEQQGRAIKVVEPLVINGSASMAMDANGNFIVVWEDSELGVSLFAQRYDSSGRTVGSRIRFSEGGDPFDWHANVAMDAVGNFAVVWQYGWIGPYVVRTYATDGTPISEQALITDQYVNGHNRMSISMAANGEFVVAWPQSPTGNENSDVYAQRFHADGTPIEEAFHVSQAFIGDDQAASVAVDDSGNFTVVWSGQGDVDFPDVFAQRYGTLMVVSAVSPEAGSIVTVPTTSFVVDFNHPYLPSSVDAGDFWVNGSQADGVQLTDFDTLTFNFDTSPVTTDGIQYVHMDAGAVTRDSDGLVLVAHDSTFRYDSVRLDVVDTIPAPGGELVLQELSSVTSAVVSMAGMNGGNGGWPVLYGPAPVSTAALQVAVDEDQLLDTERSHTYEQLAYLALGSDSTGEVAPYLRTGTVAGVGTADWTTVTLDRTYTSMVVVATANYSNLQPPLVTRVQQAAGNSFQVKVDRADGLTDNVSDIEIHYVVVEAGQYTMAEHGVTMEAHRVDSTGTDWAGSWVGQQQTYANAYANPVVIGQVLTANDPDFSVFWARGEDPYSPPSSSTLFVGKHTGEDPAPLRADEEIGYIVLEAGMGMMGSVEYLAGVGTNTVLGMDSGATTYPLNVTALEVTFNEDLNPASVGTDDLTLSSAVVLQAETVASNSVRYTLSGVADGLAVDMAAGAVVDPYGNPMLPFTASYSLPSVPHPPVANAGGPYTVVEGGAVTLDASGTTDPDLPSGDTLTYAWDFDQDGAFDDATGVNPVFDAAGYSAGATIDVSLLVTDSTGLTSTDMAVISITAAPTELVYDSTDGPLNIGDLKTVSSSIDVPDVGTIASLTVRINLTHANPSDLVGVLIAPDGTTQWTLDSGGATPILSGNHEYTVPAATGLSMDGNWTLQIQDTVKNRERGTLHDWSLIVEPEALPLLAGGTFTRSASSQAILSHQDAQQAAAAALALWVGQEGVTRLPDFDIRVADLPSGQLGQAWGRTITVDINADGAGWHTDRNAPVGGRFDLLTVVSHEIGHLLGFGHSDQHQDLMAATLPVGTRRLPDFNEPAYATSLPFDTTIDTARWVTHRDSPEVRAHSMVLEPSILHDLPMIESKQPTYITGDDADADYSDQRGWAEIIEANDILMEDELLEVLASE